MKSSHLLAITFLLATPHIHAMETEERNENNYDKPEIITEWDLEESEISGLSYHPDGNSLAIAFWDGMIETRLIKDRTLIKTYKIEPICALAYDPGGNSFTIVNKYGHGEMETRATKDGTLIKEWDFAKQLAIDGWNGDGDLGPRICALAYNPDGNSFATGHFDGKVQTRKTKDAAPMKECNFGATIRALAYPDGNSLAIRFSVEENDDEGKVHIYSTKDGTLIKKLDFGSTVCALAYSPDGNTLATGDDEGKVRIWNRLPVLTKARDNEKKPSSTPSLKKGEENKDDNRKSKKRKCIIL